MRSETSWPAADRKYIMPIVYLNGDIQKREAKKDFKDIISSTDFKISAARLVDIVMSRMALMICSNQNLWKAIISEYRSL